MTDSSKTELSYSAEPTPAKFHLDTDSFVKYMEGPFGSGKSTACIMEILMRAMKQKAFNGVRKSRWAVIRNTYPELKTTTIKTWEEWVPPSIAPIVYSMPIRCVFKQKLPDNTVCHLEVYFMALDKPEDVKKLLSMELTGSYINEAREVPWEIMENLSGRVNRYPSMREGGATDPGIIMDSNPPKTSHWLYTKFEEDPEKSWAKFKQPPAVFWDEVQKGWILNPDAENLSNLPPTYYEQQMGMGEEHIKVNLAGEYGMTRLGKPVFGKFSSAKHVAKEKIEARRGMSILVGIDFGLTPAAIIGQLDFRGVKLLDELPASDESLEDFLDQYILPLIRSKYSGYKVIACGDPAGGARSAINKMTSMQVVRQRGMTIYPAITNKFVKRKETVDYFLGRDEGFIVSPELTFTREALGAGYVYKEARNNKGEVLDIPSKNEYSHMADAIQYLCLYARYGGGALSKMASGTNGLNTSSQKSGDSKRFLWA